MLNQNLLQRLFGVPTFMLVVYAAHIYDDWEEGKILGVCFVRKYIPDKEVADTARPDTKAADTGLPNPEKGLPDTEAPDTGLSDTVLPDTKAVDTALPYTEAPDTATRHSTTLHKSS